MPKTSKHDYLNKKTKSAILQAVIEYDAIIVPGRGFKDGLLPPSSASTVQRAIQLYQEGKSAAVIFSGKYSHVLSETPPKTEAMMMGEYARTLNINLADVYLEEESQTTVENFYFVKKNILIPCKWTRICAIGISPHSKRMLLNAEYILGPEYQIRVLATDFRYPSNVQKKVEAEEYTKYQMAKHFFKDKVKGDHETIYQAALKDRQKTVT